MTKERPTHICSLEIDSRDPSAIIQALTDERDELKDKVSRQQDLIRELEGIANSQAKSLKRTACEKFQIVLVGGDKGGERTSMSYRPMTKESALRLISRMTPSGNKWLTLEPTEEDA